jgi:flagellar M-ring protein FliF
MSELAALPNETQRALPVTVSRAPASFGPMLEQIARFTSQPAVLKSIPWLITLALVGAAFMIWGVIGQPAGRTLFQGLADNDKAAVAQALDSSGIKYTLDRDSGAIKVTDEDFYKAKMLLAQQGLPKSAPDGDSVMSSLPMGASRAVEGERLRSARETDLARTIEEIDAVSSARVHLAVEQPSVFLRESSKPSASVMLRLYSGRQLSDAQVQAIVHLVGSSVPGLSPDDVSVVDQTGRLLSSAGNDPAARASNAQVQLQNKVEARYIAALNKLLTPLVGAENFTAEVHADLNFAEVQSTRESFPKDTAVVRTEEGGWTADGAGSAGGTGGIPGALSNQAPPQAQVAAAPGGVVTPPIPGAAGQTSATAAAAKTSENYNRQYQLDHEVSITKGPVGEIKRISVAVALKEDAKKKMKPAELAKLENLIKGAVGFDQTRGDVVAVSAQQFAAVAEPEDPPFYEAPWLSTVGRNIGVLVLAALLIFGIGKPMLANRSGGAMAGSAAAKSAGRAALGNEIASAIADQARANPGQQVTLDMIEAAPGYTNRAELIRNFVRQDPARAALVVRDLIRSDMPGGAE